MFGVSQNFRREAGRWFLINWWIVNTLYALLIVDKRLSKVERGLFGNNRRLSEELYELKFDNGLRIYYTEIENIVVLLFTGGNKSKQSKDIETAAKYLNDYNERKQ